MAAGRTAPADWAAAREAYIKGDMSLKALARDRGLSYKGLCRRARQEDWAGQRVQERLRRGLDRLEQVTDRLLGRMEESIESSDSIEPRDFKALSSALKELGEIQEQLHQRERPGDKGLTVRLEGELEELSR